MAGGQRVEGQAAGCMRGKHRPLDQGGKRYEVTHKGHSFSDASHAHGILRRLHGMLGMRRADPWLQVSISLDFRRGPTLRLVEWSYANSLILSGGSIAG